MSNSECESYIFKLLGARELARRLGVTHPSVISAFERGGLITPNIYRIIRNRDSGKSKYMAIPTKMAEFKGPTGEIFVDEFTDYYYCSACKSREVTVEVVSKEVIPNTFVLKVEGGKDIIVKPEETTHIELTNISCSHCLAKLK